MPGAPCTRSCARQRAAGECRTNRDASRAGTDAQRRNVRPNDLRRTFASWLKQAGVDSTVVAKLLGHTTSRMVEIVHGHLNDPTTRAAVTKLPARFTIALPLRS